MADLSLSRQTYLDAQTGNYSAGLGAERMLELIFLRARQERNAQPRC